MSEEIVQDWQHVVNAGDDAGRSTAGAPDEPATRSPAGEAFTDLVVDVAQLGAAFTAIGEQFARLGGQTLARWVILDAIETSPATVADIARRRGIARQGVQRVADLLVRDGLAVYQPNPRHRRAKLLCPTPAGSAALLPISRAQARWSNAVGGRVGVSDLAQARATLARIRAATEAGPGRARRRAEHGKRESA